MTAKVQHSMDSTDETGSASTERKSGNWACSSCYRRKIKCDRMPICSNCRKADIPCVYTSQPTKSTHTSTTRDGRKKVRGPYHKGRTVREKELEHVVELLQEKCTILEAQVHSSDKTSPSSSHGSATRPQHGSASTPARIDDLSQPFITFNSPLSNDTTSTNTSEATHPPPAQILELWLIYTTSVDPITKILHCPTFTPTLLDAIKSITITHLLIETEATLLAIYIAALNTLDPDQVPTRFNQSKDTLMSLYSASLDRLLCKADEAGPLSFGTLQALVVYMGCLRRQTGSGENIAALFSLAVKSARTLGLNDASSYVKLRPLDAELRRRAWWTICRHESAYAEEIHTRKQSIMYDANIPLPSNLDDRDIDALMTLTQMPAARVGVTGMSFALMMMEIVRMVGRLSKLFVDSSGNGSAGPPVVRSKCLKEQSRRLVEETRTRMDVGTLQYCDVSRPLDWFLLLITKLLLTKVEVMLLNYSPDSDITVINAFHDMKVALCLDIIECHQLLLREEKMKPWRWNYQHTQQWYSTIYVLEEVARRPDAAFADRVWRVVDDVFADIDLLNKHGMKCEDRNRLLEVHGRAIEAREKLLSGRDIAENAPNLSFGVPGVEFGAGVSSADVLPDYSLPARSEPWQIDQSLFDLQEAQLASMEDPFFWPSSGV